MKVYEEKTRVFPLNRHVQIVPHFNERGEISQNGVLLPEDFTPEESRYITATVVAVAPDCTQLKRSYPAESRIIVVDRSMIEEVKLHNKACYLILENHILAQLGDLSQNN